jgi:hypothetical protein
MAINASMETAPDAGYASNRMLLICPAGKAISRVTRLSPLLPSFIVVK